MKTTVFWNGQFVLVEKSLLELFTPGEFKAQGVFETILALDGKVFDIKDHLKRLQLGLKSFGMKAVKFNPLVLEQLVLRNQLDSARLRLMVWKEKQKVNVLAMALPYQRPRKKSFRVCLIKTSRPANARLANVKSLDYKIFAQAYQKAVAQGYDEALLLNAKGYIFEASRGNIFWVKDNILYTPPLSAGCLNGIMRAQIFKEARKLKIPVYEKELKPVELNQADAAFITNSLLGVMSVSLPI